MRKIDKKSQAGIITTVSLILLIIASIIIVWNVVNEVIQKSKKDVEAQTNCLLFGIEVINAINNANTITIRVMSSDPNKKISGYIVFLNGLIVNKTKKELGSLQSDIVYLSGAKLNLNDKIEVAPIINDLACSISKKYNVQQEINPVCSPNCTGKLCGDNDGCGNPCIVQTCDDNNLCTNDLCDPSATCIFTQISCAPGYSCNPLNGICESSCSDECTPSGSKRCNENRVETCGNYDADECLEWGNSFDCGFKFCVSGACTSPSNNIASSTDFNKIILVQNGGYIYTSADSGNTWIKRISAGTKNWKTISSSSDGTKLAVGVSTGYIYTSSDFGATWIERTSAGSKNWYSIASSSDGTKLAAVTFGSYIYTSTDSGAIWTQRATNKYWRSIASSSDGTKLAAVASGDYIYTSLNSGSTWIERTSAGSKSWYSIASSSDGTKLAAAAYGDYIYTSDDSGATWIERTSAGSRKWKAIASSSDGTKLVAAVESGNLYFSSDSGATWTERTTIISNNWASIVSSPDGNKTLVSNSLYVLKSDDSGLTWTQILP